MLVQCFYCLGTGRDERNGLGLCHRCDGVGTLDGYKHPVAHAYIFAMDCHRGQTDDTGADYLEAHCQHVFDIVRAAAPEDTALHAAAWLHDVIEDTDHDYTEIHAEFGADVADLVNEVTHEGRKDSKGFYFPRLRTPRGIQLKFADRLSNLSRMEPWNEKRVNHYLRNSRFWRTGKEKRFQ